MINVACVYTKTNIENINHQHFYKDANSKQPNDFLLRLFSRKYYNSEYVKKLYNGVKRNLTIPFTFYCFTNKPDEISDLNIDCKIVDISEYNLPGWYSKLTIYNPEIITGPTLYLDLDCIILSNIDSFVTSYVSQKLNSIRVFATDREPDNQEIFNLFNSSLVFVDTKDFSWLWEDIYNTHLFDFTGDQDLIHNIFNNRNILKDIINFYPNEWTSPFRFNLKNKTDAQIMSLYNAALAKPSLGSKIHFLPNYKIKPHNFYQYFDKDTFPCVRDSWI